MIVLHPTGRCKQHSGGSRGRARSPLFQETKRRPEGPKKCFWRPPPTYLRIWMTNPLNLSEGLDPPLQHTARKT